MVRDRPSRNFSVEIVQSWDIASTMGEASDYSVCTTWLVVKRNYYLLDVWRGQLEFPHLRQKLIALALEHKPNSILIEEAGPGLHLIQDFRANPVSGVPIPIGIKPEGDKLVRMEAQSARFEAGQVHLPKEAPGSPHSCTRCWLSRWRAMTTRSTASPSFSIGPKRIAGP